MTSALAIAERLIQNHDLETVLACCQHAGAEQLARQIIAQDTDAAREFGGRTDLLAAHLRAMALPQQFAARRGPTPSEPTALALELQWSADAQLRAEFGERKDVFLAAMRNEKSSRVYGVRSPSPAPTPMPSALAVAPSPAPQPARPAAASPAATLTPAARLAAPVKLCEPGREPTPFERALARQQPERFTL